MRSLVLLFALVAAPVSAHEFWLSPESYSVAPGETIRAATRVGDDFSGASYSWFPRSTEQSFSIQDGARVETEGRIGDRPAIRIQGVGEGLVVIAHETGDSTVRYDEWDKFGRFTRHKGFPDAQARHLERGGTEALVVEDYRRFAKSLVAVGAGEGADAPVGLEVEIVALANPYTDGAADIPVRVLRGGEAQPGKFVTVFEKDADGSVTEIELTTDAEGVAIVPVTPGREYQVDSVFLDEIEPSGSGATWRTLWANLTFMVPEG